MLNKYLILFWDNRFLNDPFTMNKVYVIIPTNCLKTMHETLFHPN